MSDPETEKLHAQFNIDPTTPGNHGQDDPEVQAALAEAGRAALARIQAEQQVRNDLMATEHNMTPDAKEADNVVSQYHTAAGERLDSRGKPRGDEYDPNFEKPLVSGQYHTSAGHPLDMMGRPVDYDVDAHYNEQVRMVGVAHQAAPANQTMAGQYHTSGGVPLDNYGLPIEDAPHVTMLNVLPADKSSPVNVAARNRELDETGGREPNAHIGSDTAPVTVRTMDMQGEPQDTVKKTDDNVNPVEAPVVHDEHAHDEHHHEQENSIQN